MCLAKDNMIFVIVLVLVCFLLNLKLSYLISNLLSVVRIIAYLQMYSALQMFHAS